MREEKRDLCATMKTKTRKRKECDIPDEQRCERSDRKKNWRCKNARVSHKYCQHHINLTTKNYLSRKEKTKQDPLNCCEENPKENNESIAKENDTTCRRQKDLGELLPTIVMKAWNQVLTPDERHGLRCHLPEGLDDDSAVMSILSGGTLRFGIDLAGNWCRNVCEGKENPKTAFEKEREMKICVSRYLEDLKKYHEGFIAKAEWYKRLWSYTCTGDDKVFFKLLDKYRP